MHVGHGVMGNLLHVSHMSLTGADYTVVLVAVRFECYMDIPRELHIKNSDDIGSTALVRCICMWGEGSNMPSTPWPPHNHPGQGGPRVGALDFDEDVELFHGGLEGGAHGPAAPPADQALPPFTPGAMSAASRADDAVAGLQVPVDHSGGVDLFVLIRPLHS